MMNNVDRSIVPDDAKREEAAAIIAAISAHLRNEEHARLGDTAEESWIGKRWGFASRLEEQDLQGGRVPLSAPVDEWTAAGRRDRY